MIQDVHNLKSDQKHPKPDLDPSKVESYLLNKTQNPYIMLKFNCIFFQLKGGKFDSTVVTSCSVTATRNVRGFCLPSAMCRAERREVARILEKIFGKSQADREKTGKFISFEELTDKDRKLLDQVQ